jgi:hypothetical protein
MTSQSSFVILLFHRPCVVIRIFNRPNPRYHSLFLYNSANVTIRPPLEASGEKSAPPAPALHQSGIRNGCDFRRVTRASCCIPRIAVSRRSLLEGRGFQAFRVPTSPSGIPSIKRRRFSSIPLVYPEVRRAQPYPPNPSHQSDRSFLPSLLEGGDSSPP